MVFLIFWVSVGVFGVLVLVCGLIYVFVCGCRPVCGGWFGVVGGLWVNESIKYKKLPC